MNRDLIFSVGGVASVLFVFAQMPMLIRALQTKDMRSYSGIHLLLGCAGNVLWAFHLAKNVPDVNVRALHCYYLVTTAVMLGFWWRWRR
jgi:uncharacterized protein with PQ loop repeat